MNKNELEKIHLDWVNNFLTVERFASYYGIDEKGAKMLIDALRLLFSDKKARLEYLREQIEKECISYEEIAELKSLAEYIEDGDVVLLEWAGVPEK